MSKVKQLSNRIMLGAGSVLLTASNALGALNVDKDMSGGFLDTIASRADSTIQPFAEWAADNVPLVFLGVIGCGILLFAALSALDKRKGHTQQAADHRKSAMDVFWIGVSAEGLYYLFIIISKSLGIY